MVKVFATTLDENNQIELPSELLSALNLRPHDRIRLELDGEVVRLAMASDVPGFLDLKGIVKVPKLMESVDLDQAIHDAQEEMAERIMRGIGEKFLLSGRPTKPVS